MKLARLFLTTAALLIAPVLSHAATVTKLVSFSANTFQDPFGVGVPVDPVVGSFIITFDPTLDYLNSTVGISSTSLNIALGSALAFNYKASNQRLEVGGLENGANTISIVPSSNDYWLFINGFLSTNTFDQLGYSQTASGVDSLFYTLNATGSITVQDPPPGQVPLPGALALFAGGLAALEVMRRRRKPSIE